MRPTSTENLMLMGDENIVDIEFAVLWQIKDVFKYAFDVRNPEENVRAAAEAAMREVIGRSNLQYAQTEGRSRIEQDAKDLLQRILDEYGLGVRISNVQLLRVDPPEEVIATFRDVQAARADKEKSINEANTYRNQVLPRAKGEAESIIQRAEAYKAETVARALASLLGWRQVLMVHLPIMVVASIVAIWLFTLQHRFEAAQWTNEKQWSFIRAALAGSSWLRLPRTLHWLTGNIGSHHIHHLNPRVPNYRLGTAHAAVQQVRRVRGLDLMDGLRTPWLTPWDEVSGRLVRFSDVGSNPTGRSRSEPVQPVLASTAAFSSRAALSSSSSP